MLRKGIGRSALGSNDTMVKKDEVETVVEQQKTPDSTPIKEYAKTFDDIHKIARIKVDLANIRSTPEAKDESNVVSRVTKGAEFVVVEGASKNGFVAISTGGNTAYIMESIVEVFDNPAYKAHDVQKL